MATSDGELSAELLPRKELANRTATYERSLATTALRWAIWLSMCVALGIYLAFYVAWPVNSLERIRTVLLFATVEKIGLNGTILIFFGAPFLLLTVFSIASLEVSSHSPVSKKKARGRAPLKAQPVITEGLMGMVSAAELLWIVFFLAMCLWIMANYLVPDFKRAETEKLKPYESV